MPICSGQIGLKAQDLEALIPYPGGRNSHKPWIGRKQAKGSKTLNSPLEVWGLGCG